MLLVTAQISGLGNHLAIDQNQRSSLLQESKKMSAGDSFSRNNMGLSFIICPVFVPRGSRVQSTPRLYKHTTKFLSPWRTHNPTHIQEDYTQEETKSRVYWVSQEPFAILGMLNNTFKRTEFQDCWAFYLKSKMEPGAASLPTGLGWVIALRFFCKPLRDFKSPSLTPVQLHLMSTNSAKRTTCSEH